MRNLCYHFSEAVLLTLLGVKGSIGLMHGQVHTILKASLALRLALARCNHKRVSSIPEVPSRSFLGFLCALSVLYLLCQSIIIPCCLVTNQRACSLVFATVLHYLWTWIHIPHRAYKYYPRNHILFRSCAPQQETAA